jgi:hypothetical protein
MSHRGGGVRKETKKKKVSHIIWMAPKTPALFFASSIFIKLDQFEIDFSYKIRSEFFLFWFLFCGFCFLFIDGFSLFSMTTNTDDKINNKWEFSFRFFVAKEFCGKWCWNRFSIRKEYVICDDTLLLFITQTFFFNYIAQRLIESIWVSIKVITITECYNKPTCFIYF